MLQLRKSSKSRFIIFSLLGNGGRARTIILLEGAKVEGWFGVTKILKESEIGVGGHENHSPIPRGTPFPSRVAEGRDRSAANVVRGRLGGPHDSQWGWKCRACGSWDVFAAMIGEDQDGDRNVLKQKVSSRDSANDVSLSLTKKSGSKDLMGVSSFYLC